MSSVLYSLGVHKIRHQLSVPAVSRGLAVQRLSVEGRARLSLSGSWVRVGHIANDREVLKETRPHVLIGTPGSRSCQRCGCLPEFGFETLGGKTSTLPQCARKKLATKNRGVNFTVRSDGEGHLKTEDAPASGRAAKHVLWSFSQCQHSRERSLPASTEQSYFSSCFLAEALFKLARRLFCTSERLANSAARRCRKSSVGVGRECRLETVPHSFKSAQERSEFSGRRL